MRDTPASLVDLATELRSGRLPLAVYLNELCDRIDARDAEIRALLPEPGRRERLLCDAAALAQKHPVPEERPSLYGIPVGVKDIFHVDGFVTRAGSRLPPELFA